jgi:hypothetical protein
MPPLSTGGVGAAVVAALGGAPATLGATCAGLCAAAALSFAPLQCAPRRGDAAPGASTDAARSADADSAPEALWALAERLEADGARDARRRALEFLVERYPSSRFARRAAIALEADEAADGDGDAGAHP